MEYQRLYEIVDGVEATNNFIRENADGSTSSIPEAPGNRDYDTIVAEVAEGVSSIIDVDTTHYPDYAELRAQEYGSVQDQLDMIYWDGENGTTVWRDHVASVKAAHPKPA